MKHARSLSMTASSLVLWSLRRPPTPAGGGSADDESSLVAALLAQIETLGLPADAMATLQQQRTALADAIAPHVNAMRNRHYVQGFNARG